MSEPPPRPFVVVTNNGAVRAAYGGVLAVEYVDGTPLDALGRASLLLRRRCRLLSAPLPPNVPLMRAPFRSLLLEETANGEGDPDGIYAIEKARETMRAQRAISVRRGLADSAEADFAALDADWLARALREARLLPPEDALLRARPSGFLLRLRER